MSRGVEVWKGGSLHFIGMCESVHYSKMAPCPEMEIMNVLVFWAKTRVFFQTTYVQELHLRALLLTCKGGGSPSLSEDSCGVNCRTGVASVPSEHDRRIYPWLSCQWP